jgi:aminoglycoside 3-N-acetyltransferase
MMTATNRPIDHDSLGRDRARLASDLRALGLRPGHDALVHCSMRRIGRVDDGPATLVAAIHDVLGPDATLVVPTHTATNSTTTRRFRAATSLMDAARIAEFEARMPGFDRASSPSVGMGALAEHVKCRPDSVRSDHQQASPSRVPATLASHPALVPLLLNRGRATGVDFAVGWLTAWRKR